MAISLEDLLTLRRRRSSTAHADAIRKRLLELHEQLKVDFPVYALFTKADLVAGFIEYFGDLTESEPPHGLGRARSRPRTARATWSARCRPNTTRCIERLNEELPDRLQEEPDAGGADRRSSASRRSSRL